MTMRTQRDEDQPRASASGPATPSKRARLQALLFAAGSIGTTLLTLGLLADNKLPRYQAE
jgi:hypothetical protein